MLIEKPDEDYPQINNDKEWEEWANKHGGWGKSRLAHNKPDQYPVRVLSVKAHGGKTHYIYRPKHKTDKPSSRTVWIHKEVKYS